VPRAVGPDALTGALLLDVRQEGPAIPGAARAADLSTFRPGRRVVVVDEAGQRAPAVAERLCALGVEADWLAQGWST
jgi:rhodanese-related sulfurtransferase